MSSRGTPAPPPSPPPRRGPGERPGIALAIIIVIVFVGAVALGVGLPEPAEEGIVEQVLEDLRVPAADAEGPAGPAATTPADEAPAEACARVTITDAYGLPVEIERC